MENSTLLIDSRKRLPLTRGNRIYHWVYGIILVFTGTFQIIEIDSPLFNVGLILIGASSLAYGIIGKEIFRTHYYIKIDSNLITSKNSVDGKNLIDIKSITYIKTLSFAFEVTLGNYVRTINLSWMTPDEFQMIRTKLEGLSRQKRIIME